MNWLAIYSTLNPLERALLRGEQSVCALSRMVPHDGDFGLSGWAVCHGDHCPLQIVIQRREPNMVDPISGQHMHMACYEAARSVGGNGTDHWAESVRQSSDSAVGVEAVAADSISDTNWREKARDAAENH